MLRKSAGCIWRVNRGIFAASAVAAAAKARLDRTNEIEVVLGVLDRLSINWKGPDHPFHDHAGPVQSAPDPRISRESKEIFLRADGNPSVSSFLDERSVVGSNHESWFVSLGSHALRKPQEWVHVSLASEWNEEDSEWHG